LLNEIHAARFLLARGGPGGYPVNDAWFSRAPTTGCFSFLASEVKQTAERVFFYGVRISGLLKLLADRSASVLGGLLHTLFRIEGPFYGNLVVNRQHLIGGVFSHADLLR
jgi:hypothetical protein